MPSHQQDHAGAALRLDPEQLRDLQRIPEKFAAVMEQIDQLDLDKFKALIGLAAHVDDLREVIISLEDLPVKLDKLVGLLERSDKVEQLVEALNVTLPTNMEKLVSLLSQIVDNTGGGAAHGTKKAK
jgi:hypothetical protein